MLYLVSEIWGWMILCALVGILIGWLRWGRSAVSSDALIERERELLILDKQLAEREQADADARALAALEIETAPREAETNARELEGRIVSLEGDLMTNANLVDSLQAELGEVRPIAGRVAELEAQLAQDAAKSTADGGAADRLIEVEAQLASLRLVANVDPQVEAGRIAGLENQLVGLKIEAARVKDMERQILRLETRLSAAQAPKTD